MIILSIPRHARSAPCFDVTHHHNAGNRCSRLISYVFSYCTSQQRVHRDRITSLVCLFGSYLKIVLTGCSTYIYIGEDNRATLSDLLIYVGSVPTEHLDTFDAKLHESFRRIIKDGVDLNRMKMVIDRDERQVFFRSVGLFSTSSNSCQAAQQSRSRWGRRILINHDWQLSLWTFGWLSN
jgi:hypothetical protein